MKGTRYSRLILIIALGLGFFIIESCAASRSNCCNDLSRDFKAPKSHKRNVY